MIIQSPGIVESTDDDNSYIISEEKVRLGDKVALGDKCRLMSILKKYNHCFASDLRSLGKTDITLMNIELKNQRPIVYRPYRLSHHERDKVQKMVGEILEAGIVRESVSEFASPIILVRKKDGRDRMCVNYSMLNNVTT
jgi:hypothetical protein